MSLIPILVRILGLRYWTSSKFFELNDPIQTLSSAFVSLRIFKTVLPILGIFKSMLKKLDGNSSKSSYRVGVWPDL